MYNRHFTWTPLWLSTPKITSMSMVKEIIVCGKIKEFWEIFVYHRKLFKLVLNRKTRNKVFKLLFLSQVEHIN